MQIMRGTAGAFDLFQDVTGLGRPDKELRVFVMVSDVVVDSENQLLDAAENAAAQPIFRQVTKKSLYHVQLRATGRGKVRMEPWMASEPALHLFMLVTR